MMRQFLALSAAAMLATSVLADHKAIVPTNGPKPVGPYTPGVAAEGLLYVSGQGARDLKGQLPPAVPDQIRQCLENVKGVLTAGGLGMEHVVTTTVYLTDMKNLATLNQVWGTYFPKDRPVRTVIGVVKMPGDTPVEISAVAVQDIRRKKTIMLQGAKPLEPVSTAVSIGDRVYLTALAGHELTGTVPKDPRVQVKVISANAEQVLKSAGLDLRHLVYANIYIDSSMPMPVLGEVLDELLPDETARTIVQTNALPAGTHMIVSGLASRDLRRSGGHCATVGETIYCSGRGGTIRQALDSLKADLQISKMDFSHAVATTVFMDDISQFAAMNKVYAGYFGKVPPTRTTVQPWKAVQELSLPPTTGTTVQNDDSPRAQVNIIAVHAR